MRAGDPADATDGAGGGEAPEVRLPCEHEDVRLDRFLSESLPEQSRVRLQALIRNGAVRVNDGAVLRPGARLHRGASVAIDADALQAQPACSLEPENIPLEVLYEDDDLAVVNKPAGLVVHAGAGHRNSTLVNALLYRFGGLSQLGGAARPGIVHRLDRFTSGVMVVARNDRTHRKLAEQFQDRTVRKTYLALVHGRMPQEQGEIQLPIHRDLRHRTRMTTKVRGGRSAHTSYKVLQAFSTPGKTNLGYSWLELALHTGRTHQIRVHLAALGHPVVGDRLYGAPGKLAGPGALAGVQPERVMLHAAHIEFQHPRSGQLMRCSAPLPAALADLVSELQAF